MPPKKPERKLLLLEASFEDILVCNDKSLRPLLEAFVFEPENIDQKNLGTLFGIFEVADNSEDSSYIVNYLLSVIKKEYFSKPKRPPIESFEAALHRGNLALSKIAEHGNVAWIGKLNAIIAIIEKNNLHLTQAGNTSAFLFRSNSLTNVSEGLSSPEADSNPLKTFVNVSSGRMEKADKIIVTTESIFDIFSLEEIKKSILRFSKADLVQFLKTALVNELQKAAVLIIDVDEKALPLPMTAPKKASPTPNVFSQNAFKKEAELKKKTSSQEILEEIKKEELIQEETKKQNNGHLYIKETAEPEKKNETIQEAALIIGEKFELIQESSLKFFKKLANRASESVKRISAPKDTPQIEAPKKEFRLSSIAPHLSNAKEKIANSLHSVDLQKHFSKFKEKTNSAIIAVGKLKARTNLPKIPLKKPAINPTFTKTKNKALNLLANIAPNLSKLRNLGLRLNYQQRLYTGLIILAVILIPLLIMRFTADTKPVEQPTQVATEITENPNQDKNIVRVENLVSVYSDQELFKLIDLNDKLIVLTQTQITDLESKTSTPIPENFGKIKLATGMDDLGLIFILNEENKILSFSPVSRKFQDNILNMPADSNITAIGTYLTYLYAVDAKNSQIYRFPRAAGGFGEKSNWLKDSVDLAQAKNMSINDNIFIVTDAGTLKLFRNKKQEFNIEETYHKIVPALAFTTNEQENIFILDKQNSKIAKLTADGAILTQYFNPEIEKASDFAISETSGLAYLLIGNDLKTFKLN